MRFAVLFKLFKLDRATPEIAPAAPVAAVPTPEPAPAATEAPASTERDAAPVPLEAANTNERGAEAASDDHDAEAATANAVPEPAPPEPRFQTTADLDPLDGPLGQHRALASLARAAAVAGSGFHIAVVADEDLLATDAVRAVLADARVRTRTEPADWLYVHDFTDHTRPRALRLPSGRGRSFADQMHAATAEALFGLDAAFRSEERTAQHRAIDAETRDALDERLLAIKTRAEAQNLAVLRTPGGYVVAPIHEGKVVKPEVFARLPEPMRADVEARVTALQTELATTLAERPAVERDRRARLEAADAALARAVVTTAFADARAAFADVPAAMHHVAAVIDDLAADATARAEAGGAGSGNGHGAIPRRYRVNVFHATATTAEPSAGIVVVAAQASPSALLGHGRRNGGDAARAPDHLDLAPGAAHLAQGGTLLVDAGRLARCPDGAAALEHLLATAEIVIEDAAPALRPEPIPLDARVVLLGDRDAIQRLAHVAPGLLARFRSTVLCDDTTERTADAEHDLARRFAAATAAHDLLPLDAAAVAHLVDVAARMADRPGHLSAHIAPLIDIAREADVLARNAARASIGRDDIASASAARDGALATLAAGYRSGTP